jgi:hypothetical protein
MATAAGYRIKMGCAKETSFRTAVHMTDLVPVLSETLTENIKIIDSQVLKGIAGQDQIDLGERSYTGTIETDCVYPTKSGSVFFGNDMFISMAMGAHPSYGSSLTGARFTESPDHCCTIAIDKVVSIWEFISCYFKTMKISAKVGESVKASFDVIAYNCLLTGTANEAAEFTAIAGQSAKKVLFADATFRLGDHSNALAASTDEIGLSEFNLNLDNNFSDPTFSSPNNDTGHTNAYLTIQPERNGKRIIDVDFKLSRYNTGGTNNWGTQLETWKSAKTPLQMDAIWSIDSAARKFLIHMPYLIITDLKENVNGAGLVDQQVKAKLLYNGGTTAGGGVNTVMVDSGSLNISQEFEIEWVNTANGRTAAIWS